MRGAATAFSFALFALAAFAADGLFVRTSSDGLRTEIGTNAVAVRAHSIHFTLLQPDFDRWPAEAAITIKESSGPSTWNVVVQSRFAIKPHTLRAPAGTYDMTFSMPHHRAISRRVRLDTIDVNLGTLTLVRYPVLSGTIRDIQGSPLASAFVSDGGRHSAKSDPLGVFTLETDGDWPSQIEISYPGLTTKQIYVPKPKTSVKLPPITLSKGSRLEIEIEGLKDDAGVDLAQESGYQRVAVLKTSQVKKQQSRAVFEDIDQGEFVVLIRGASPLQRLATTVSVAEAETVTRKIRIEPINLTIEVRRGEKPVADAIVAVRSDANRWSSDVRTGADGTTRAEAWQRGEYVFVVRVTESSPPLLLFNHIDGKSEATVHLEVPDRAITGRVIDREDGTPVSKAAINMESKNDDDTGGRLTVSTDAEGKFVIDALRDGSHTLSVEADQYVRSEPVTVRIDQTSPRREVAFRVSHGVTRNVRVTTRGGLPIQRAFVIEMTGDEAIGTFRTDDAGRGTVHGPMGRPVVLYVIPEEGSFAIARLSSAASDKEESVVVPDGNAILELHANTSTGKPIPHLRFVMRFDGEIIPPDVAEVLEIQRGIAAVTGVDGVARLERLPQGFFELWPIRKRDEAINIIAGGGVAAPVQVALKEGLNLARITFALKNETGKN